MHASHTNRPPLSAVIGIGGIMLGLVAIRTGFTITIDDFIVHNLPVGIAGTIAVLVGLISLIIWIPGAIRARRQEREQLETERQEHEPQEQDNT